MGGVQELSEMGRVPPESQIRGDWIQPAGTRRSITEGEPNDAGGMETLPLPQSGIRGAHGRITEGESSDSGTTETLPLESADYEVCVCIRLLSDGYPIAKCSLGFTILSGPLVRGTNLLDWVLNPNEFNRWLLSSSYSLLNGLEPA